MVLDELNAVTSVNGTCNPDKETDDADAEDKHHPEPEEEVDFLIVHVNWKDALDRIALSVDHVLAAHVKIAEGHTWEGDVALVLRPVLGSGHCVQHVEAESVVLHRKNLVEKEELGKDVHNVEYL